MRVDIFCDDERGLYVKTPFALKDVCKSILGRQWDAEMKAWKYPATASAAQSLADAFQGHTINWSPSAKDLLDRAKDQASAQAFKTAEELPDIPMAKTKPWKHQKQAFWFAIEMLGGLPK